MIQDNNNTLIKTKFINFQFLREDTVASKMATDFSETYFKYNKVSELVIGDFLYYPKHSSVNNVKNKKQLAINTLLVDNKDVCYIINKKERVLLKNYILNKNYDKQALSDILTKYNLEENQIHDFLKLTKTVVYKTPFLDINKELLTLISLFITNNYHFDQNDLLFLKVSDINVRQNLLNYFKHLSYNTTYSKNVIESDSGLLITSKLFIQLFKTNFFNLQCLNTLSNPNKTFLFFLIKNQFNFFSFDDFTTAKNFQEYMYSFNVLVNIEFDDLLKSYQVTNHKDFYIKTPDGFLIEILKIITIT